jgi:hypothetical protein
MPTLVMALPISMGWGFSCKRNIACDHGAWKEPSKNDEAKGIEQMLKLNLGL